MAPFERFLKLRRFVLAELSQQLSPKLTYHGIHHVRDVLSVCRQYIKRLSLREPEAELLLTGALIHDIGFTETYQGHEEKGIEIAKQLLPNFGFTSIEIMLINGLIISTKVPQQPLNLIEQILCDADLDYLGRSDFDPISESLFQELQNMDMLHERKKWDEIQIKFLESHTYHTPFAKKHRQPKKEQRIKEIKERLLG
ncbi:MAG TPA: hydrolase [Runella sp.]|nr:hydrolase [Runella sp.]